MVEWRVATDRNVNRVLIANAAAILAVLASYPAFYFCGQWSSITPAYVIIALGILILCVLSLVIANHINARVGLVFYAWCGFGAVAGMLALDIGNGGRDFPWLLYLLHLGVFCLGRFKIKLHRWLFTAAALFVVIIAGAVYRQYDQAIACGAAALLIAVAT